MEVSWASACPCSQLCYSPCGRGKLQIGTFGPDYITRSVLLDASADEAPSVSSRATIVLASQETLVECGEPEIRPRVPGRAGLHQQCFLSVSQRLLIFGITCSRRNAASRQEIWSLLPDLSKKKGPMRWWKAKLCKLCQDQRTVYLQ